jgi:hypothetical protein
MEHGNIISREPGLTVCELHGTPREMGFAHGRLFEAEIALMRERLMSYLTSITFGIGGRTLLLFFGFLSRQMEPFVPGGLKEEMRGIAQGSRQDYRFIFLLNSLDDVLVNSACSSVAISPENSLDGRLIVGRNLDYPLFFDLLPKLTTVFKIMPFGRQGFVSVGWPGFSAVVTGMNASGVCIADLTSISRDKTMKGMPALLLNRKALGNSRDLDEMTGILKDAHRTVGKNIMTASPAGARVLELSAKGFNVREGVSGLLACTNHYEGKEMAARQGSVKAPPKSDFPQSYYSYAFSKERMDKLSSLVGGRKVGVEDVTAALGTEPVANGSTVQSVVFVPETRRILVARRESTPVSLGEYRELTGIL